MRHGTHDVHSDLDLLIVTKDDFQNKQIGERVEQFAQELALKADVLVYQKVAIERMVKPPHSFLASVWLDGMVVYRKCK